MKKIFLNTGVVYEGGFLKIFIFSSLKGDIIFKFIEIKKVVIVILYNCFGY